MIKSGMESIARDSRGVTIEADARGLLHQIRIKFVVCTPANIDRISIIGRLIAVRLHSLELRRLYSE